LFRAPYYYTGNAIKKFNVHVGLGLTLRYTMLEMVDGCRGKRRLFH